MQNEHSIPMAELVEPEQRPQFSLRTLFQFMFVCGLILLGSSADQAVSTFMLIGFALALLAGRGNLALALLAGAILGAQRPADSPDKDLGLVCVCLVLLKGGVIAWWFAYRAAARDVASAAATGESLSMTPQEFHRTYRGWSSHHGQLS